MSTLRNMTIKNKLYGGFGLILILLLVVAFTSYFYLSRSMIPTHNF